MKRLLVALMCLTLFVSAALPTMAYGRYCRCYHRGYYSRTVYRTYRRGYYYAPRRVYYVPRRVYYAPRRVYYDYGYRDRRSFWQKHRDKLTVAMGAGGGALLGGLIGGGRGAGIGALAGAGTSALYTYKLRHRHHHYYYRY